MLLEKSHFFCHSFILHVVAGIENEPNFDNSRWGFDDGVRPYLNPTSWISTLKKGDFFSTKLYWINMIGILKSPLLARKFL